MQRDYEKFPRWRRTLRQKLYYSLLTVENAERDTATLCSGLSRSARSFAALQKNSTELRFVRST